MSVPVQPSSFIEIDIDKPAAGGRMLGRHHGLVVLVAGAIPGERVRARVERVGKGVAYAETVDVLRPSSDRRDAVDVRCGGNVLAHIAYPRQVQLKSEIIQDAFRRIARTPLSLPPVVIPSPETGYRMRARLHATDGRLGFYREGTHQRCDATATGQLMAATGDWIAATERILRDRRLTGLAGIEIAENVSGDRRACHLDLHAGTDAEAFACLADDLVGLSAGRSDRPDVQVLAGRPVIADEVRLGDDGAGPTVTLQRDVRAFFQGNRFLLETLARHVVALVAPGPIVDLYAGVGLLGLSAAAAGADDVTLVEGDQVSAADLKANAEPYPAAQVTRRSVESYLGVARPFDRPATFIVDPPRTGLSKEALAGIIRLRPATIVYVSCDVATLARDTRVLIDSGYAIGGLTAFDLFPNTAHVETVARFSREGPTPEV
jgi:tRNA/tmRNA/rRNA uracil-C5-methylase (TrmA/RlmC/RlmD family)